MLARKKHRASAFGARHLAQQLVTARSRATRLGHQLLLAGVVAVPLPGKVPLATRTIARPVAYDTAAIRALLGLRRHRGIELPAHGQRQIRLGSVHFSFQLQCDQTTGVVLACQVRNRLITIATHFTQDLEGGTHSRANGTKHVVAHGRIWFGRIEERKRDRLIPCSLLPGAAIAKVGPLRVQKQDRDDARY